MTDRRARISPAAQRVEGTPSGEAFAHDPERAPTGAFLIECAWEVCNKLGGIYQVLRSKAPAMTARWRNRYALVGPYVPEHAQLEFESRRPSGWIASALQSLAAQGLLVHHGFWLVPGRPRVFLIDHEASAGTISEQKYELYEHHRIDSPANGIEPLFDGTVGFAFGVRTFVRTMAKHWVGRPSSNRSDPPRRVVFHAHEWMGGLAIPLLRREKAPVSTVFTTHATRLGRAIAADQGDLFETIKHVDDRGEAERRGVKHEHAIERACAHGSHVFTTVSNITGEECRALLGRKPDLVLPNGLSIETFNVGHEFQTLHAQYKEKIHQFVMGHFFPSYSFDLDKTLYFFTSGRFEPGNKGFDLCLESMARLNTELKASRSDITVVFFIVTKTATRSLLPEVLQSRGVLEELRDVCDNITSSLNEKLFRHAAAGERVKLDRLVDEYWSLRFRRTQHALSRAGQPAIVTHQLRDEHNDPVLNHIRSLWLVNGEQDRVKVVYHPEFISPVSPLWGMEYEHFVRGCHLGVFPSAYEPWGYTPLECMAMGVPTVTSDLAGFGRYAADSMPDIDPLGLCVLKRYGRGFHESAADLTKHLVRFCGQRRRDRIALRNLVERRSWEYDWKRLVNAYNWAHDLAMARAGSVAS